MLDTSSLPKKRKKWVVGITGVVIAMVCLSIFLWHSKPIHDADLGRLTPLRDGKAKMSMEDVNQTLSEKFEVADTVGKMPDSIKISFCRVVPCTNRRSFDMVDPGALMSSDVLIPGVPNKRLRFAALNSHAAVVVFEVGGFADSECVEVIDLRARRSWGARLEAYEVTRLDLLQSVIRDKHFQETNSP